MSFTRFKKIILNETDQKEAITVHDEVVEQLSEVVSNEKEEIMVPNEITAVTNEVVEQQSDIVSDEKEEQIDIAGLISKIDYMTKSELDAYAKSNYDIELDRRQTKQNMIEEFTQKLKEKN